MNQRDRRVGRKETKNVNAGDIVACVTFGECRLERQITMSIFLSHRVPVLVTGFTLRFLPFARYSHLPETYVSKVVLFTTTTENILSSDARNSFDFLIYTLPGNSISKLKPFEVTR